MAASSSQNQNRSETGTSSQSGSQVSSQTQQQQGQSTQTQTQTGTKGTWFLPSLNTIQQRVVSELNAANGVPTYQIAGLNDSEKAALATLQQGRDKSQLQALLGQLQQQGTDAADLPGVQNKINNLAQGFYDAQSVKNQISELESTVNRNLGNQVAGINRGAIGTGNMASSRTGIAEGIASRGASENIAKGTAQIENSARQEANQLATNLFSQQQAFAQQNLAAQVNLQQIFSNWDQMDAQTKFNAAQQIQKATQQQMDVDRLNAIIKASPNLQTLQQYLPALTSLGSMGTNVSQTGSGTSSETGSSSGTTNTSGNQTSNTSGNTNFTGNASGSGESTGGWADIGQGLAGQAAGFALQPIASAAGSKIASTVGGWLSDIF